MDEISASDYESWKLFYKEEPFGGPWENWLMAIQTDIIAKANFKKPPKLKDYFYEDPDYKRERDTHNLCMWFASKAKH